MPTLTLPLPPSVNRLWRSGHGRVFPLQGLRGLASGAINRPLTYWHCLFPRNFAGAELPVFNSLNGREIACGGSLSQRHHRPKLGCLAAGKTETPP